MSENNQKNRQKNRQRSIQNTDSIVADKILDCVGLFCPFPIFNTTEAIEEMDDEEILEVMTDDPASVQDIPRWAKRRGHQLLKFENAGDHYRFLIKK